MSKKKPFGKEVQNDAVTEPVDDLSTEQEQAIEALEQMSGKDLEIVDGELTIVDDLVISVHEAQLNIYESKVVPVPAGAKRAVVENIGGGDLYVDSMAVQYTIEYRISPGQSKEFKGAKNILLGSASRPHVRITFLKK